MFDASLNQHPLGGGEICRLRPGPDALRDVRHWVEEVVGPALGDPDATDEAVLLTGEGVGNACRFATSDAEIVVTVATRPGQAVVEIVDHCSEAPDIHAMPTVDPDDVDELPEHGYGVPTIDRLALRWATGRVGDGNCLRFVVAS